MKQARASRANGWPCTGFAGMSRIEADTKIIVILVCMALSRRQIGEKHCTEFRMGCVSRANRELP
jgi:hypothetical protein